MKITTDHSASSYGIPVVLDDAGAVMDTAPGLKAVRAALKLSRADLAALTNVSPRTIEFWEHGRGTPQTRVLNVLADLLAKRTE
jgi:DNA-binding transcriptional regulator YiaG